MMPVQAKRALGPVGMLLVMAGCNAGSPAGTALAEAAAENAPLAADSTKAASEEQTPRDENAWIVATLTKAHESEPRDGSWAPAAERHLEAVTSRAELASGTTVSASCRQTICLVRITFTATRAQELLRSVQFDEAFATSGYFTIDRDDPGKALMFVSREGTMLNEHPEFLAAVQATRAKGG
jgi:hypothetical protein